MKKIVLIFSAVVLLTSCKNTTDKAAVMEDNKQAVIDSMKTQMAKKESALAKQKSIDSMKVIMDRQHAQKVTVVHDVAGAPTTTTTTVVQKRKGWSRAAKGAVIGAGVGAITGAVIDKKHHGEGAIIGGLAGAGVGAGTGAILDSKKNK